MFMHNTCTNIPTNVHTYVYARVCACQRIRMCACVCEHINIFFLFYSITMNNITLEFPATISIGRKIYCIMYLKE